MTFRPTELVRQPTGAAAVPDVRVVAAEDVPRNEVEAARQRIARLQRAVSRPLTRAQLTLCRAGSDSQHPYAADASLLVDGRLLAAHAAGRTALKATNAAAEGLLRELRRVDGTRIPSPRDLLRDREAEHALAEEEQRGWRRQGEALVRELAFRDFDEAMRFVERIGQAAADYLRRPDICILEFNRVRLRIANLHHGPLTLAEARLAAKVDAIIAELRPDAIAHCHGRTPGRR
ncbi:MAG: 4a-hydroxytetrahydrobiopterin dehydratase [Solirubrobacteraceae bacterium]